MAEFSGYMLRMRQIPKPEYKLMKQLVKRYNLKDDSELFQVAVVLMYEIGLHQGIGGEKWVAQVISTLRTLGEKERQYTLSLDTA